MDTQTPEIRKDPFVPEKKNILWEYPKFKEYLINVANNPDSLLPADDYPRAIQLSRDWHEILNRKRVHSHNDGLERFSAIVVTTDNKVYIPNFSSVGAEGMVLPGTIQEEFSRSDKMPGKKIIVGDIHSHPRKLHRGFKRFFDNLSTQPKDGFSMGDLYGLLLEENNAPLSVVVSGEETLFAFRSSETKDTLIKRFSMNGSNFAKYWYENNGYLFKGYDPKRGELADPSSNAAPIIELNKKVAQKHKLCLYKGNQGNNLTRIY